MTEKNIYLDGIMGVVVGDALGCPVEFVNREELEANPVTDMGEYGTYNMPKGTWTDDSSMTLATLDALRYGYDKDRIQENFVKWLYDGKFTPAGLTFDVGVTCEKAIFCYSGSMARGDRQICGLDDEYSNGNGSLMRIMPICLFVHELVEGGVVSIEEAVNMIHEVSSFTHAHMRSKIACGLYFFIVQKILKRQEDLSTCIMDGLSIGFKYYDSCLDNQEDLKCYGRLRDLKFFSELKSDEIISTGYVVTSLEAAIWSLITTNSFEEATLKAVNLGGDTDTIAAITGGLAGLYYGIESIPIDWRYSIQRREWIEKKCVDVAKIDKIHMV